MFFFFFFFARRCPCALWALNPEPPNPEPWRCLVGRPGQTPKVDTDNIVLAQRGWVAGLMEKGGGKKKDKKKGGKKEKKKEKKRKKNRKNKFNEKSVPKSTFFPEGGRFRSQSLQNLFF